MLSMDLLGPRGYSHMMAGGGGRGVNPGFWSHLRCSGKNANFLAVSLV